MAARREREISIQAAAPERGAVGAIRVSAVAVLLAAIAGLALMAGPDVGQSQEPAASLAIDADPSENSATSLGSSDECVSVKKGDTFDVDLVIRDVNNLLAWEVTVGYDSDVVEVVDREVELFQAADGVSTIFDVSQSTPDSDGTYGLGAVDTADPVAPDSGSGVLARLTLKAKGQGVSPLSLETLDLNDDTVPDRGPVLRNDTGEAIGDASGDGLFDGPISDAEVAVDAPCANGGVSTADDGGFPWLILGLILAGAAVVAVAAGGLRAYRASRRGRPSGE